MGGVALPCYCRFVLPGSPMTRTASRAGTTLPCLLLLILSLSTAWAQQVIKVPAGQPTIQAGIDAANTGDTVLVAPGTYLENIDFMGKAIIVTSSDGAAKTILDGSQGQKPAVFFTHSETRASTLSGFTVQNGGAEADYATRGGILIDNAAPTLLSNIITRNHCYGVWVRASSPLLQDNVISNTLSAGSCTFAGGSGVWLEDSLAVTSGLRMHPQFFRNTFENNTQSGQENSGGNGGAGIAVWSGSPIIQNNIFRNNRTFAGTGGGINVVVDGDGVTILHNLIYGNEAGCGGGGLAFHFGSNGGPGPIDDFVENNTIVGNTTSGVCGFADHGPASQIYLWRSSSRRVFVNNIIVGTSSNPAITDDTTFDNAPVGLNIFDHNLIYNPQGKLVGGNLVDPTGTFGNISVDPQFLNQAANDFHLPLGSPAIDTGNNGAPNAGSIAGNIPDFDGRFAPQDATGKGYPILDIGAYELPGAHTVHSTLLHLLPSIYQTDPSTAVSLTANLLSANGVPTGPVLFLEDGKQVGAATADATGTAILSLPGLTPGIHTFLATYAGQGSFTSAISVEVVILVNRYVPTLTLTSTPNPSNVGQNVTFTATITSPDHTVPSPITINDGTNTASLTPDANGVATYTFAFPTAGSFPVTATYAGDATHASASATVTQVVTAGSATSTSITSSPNPANVGQPVTFVLSVSNTSGNGQIPTGSITVSDGSTVLATLPLTAGPTGNGGATYTTSTLAAGSHTITATYVPTGAFAASSASLVQVINGQGTATLLTASPNPVQALAPVNLLVTVTAAGVTPSGTVTFFDGTTPLGSQTLDANGSATFTATFTSAGVHPLHATYTSTSSLAPGTSNTVSETVLINPTTTALQVSPLPSTPAFTTITLTSTTRSPSSAPVSTAVCTPACVAPAVNFLANGNPIGTAAVGPTGAAVLTVTLPAGTYAFSSAYPGTPAFSPSNSASVTELVVPVSPNFTLTAQPNPALQHQVVTLTANLATPNIPASAITGTISFFDGASPLGSVPVSSAAAVLTISTLSVGTHQISAVYSGNTTLNGASSAVTVTILSQDFTLTTAAPGLTIKTEHHAPIKVTITTTGGLADSFHLSCGNLPEFVTCTFNPGDLTTTSEPNVTRTSTLIIDTDAVLFYAHNQPAPRPFLSNPLNLAFLFPLTLLGGLASRRRLPRLLLAALLTTTFALTLNGCSGKYPGHTPPGIYPISIQAQGRTSGIAHSTTITLTVVP